VSLGKTYTEGVTDNGGSLITLPSKDQCSTVFLSATFVYLVTF
jgi:hypothetical protein